MKFVFFTRILYERTTLKIVEKSMFLQRVVFQYQLEAESFPQFVLELGNKPSNKQQTQQKAERHLLGAKKKKRGVS